MRRSAVGRGGGDTSGVGHGAQAVEGGAGVMSMVSPPPVSWIQTAEPVASWAQKPSSAGTSVACERSRGDGTTDAVPGGVGDDRVEWLGTRESRRAGGGWWWWWCRWACRWRGGCGGGGCRRRQGRGGSPRMRLDRGRRSKVFWSSATTTPCWVVKEVPPGPPSCASHRLRRWSRSATLRLPRGDRCRRSRGHGGSFQMAERVSPAGSRRRLRHVGRAGRRGR